MIVTCPACSTRYLVDPRALGSAGRKVRCAHCTHTWHQAPSEELPRPLEVAPELAASAPGAGQIAADDASLDPFGRRRGARAGRYPPPSLPVQKQRWPARLGIGLAAALLVIGVIAGIAMRDSVMMKWPVTGRLFGALGLEALPPTAGLQLGPIDTRRDKENGAPVLIIEGSVVNTTSAARAVPRIRILLTDKDNNPVQSVVVTPTGAQVPGGGSVPFRTTINQPSDAATVVRIEFADGG